MIPVILSLGVHTFMSHKLIRSTCYLFLTKCELKINCRVLNTICYRKFLAELNMIGNHRSSTRVAYCVKFITTTEKKLRKSCTNQ